jgi:hypothetical protein
MLYRSVIQFALENHKQIYQGYENESPFATIDSPEPKWSWPIVNEAPSGKGKSDLDLRDFSALKLLGYSVGKSAGWSQDKRRRFLSNFMEKELPALVNNHLGDDYGLPSSPIRLRKVSNGIAGNSGLFIKNDPAKYKYAINDWLEDLEFLKARYYDGLGLKFNPMARAA